MDIICEEDLNCNSVAVDKHFLWCNWKNDAITKINFKKKTYERVKVNLLSLPFHEHFKYGVNNVLLAVGTDRDDKLHAESIDTKDHQTDESLTFSPMDPGDRATKQLLDQKFHYPKCLKQLPRQNGEMIFTVETKGKHCIFGLKLIGSKCRIRAGATGTSINGLPNHIEDILTSG